MPDLIAQGPQPKQRWRRPLPIPHNHPDQVGDSSLSASAVITLGRDGPGKWTVPWDDRISREHVALQPQEDGSVWVQRLPAAKNPVFYRGQRQDSFRLLPGEHFVIGHTSFTLAIRPEINDADRRAEVTEHVYNVTELRSRGFRDAGSRIEALGRLPDIIIGSTNDEELLVRVVSLLLQSIPSASAVAVLDVSKSAGAPPRMLHYDHRIAEAEGPRPSGTIARQAVATRQTVLHLWAGGEAGGEGGGEAGAGGAAAAERYTASEGVDWAFCVPLPTAACNGWVIYVTGQLTPRLDGGYGQSLQAAPEDLHDDVKFAELVGTTLGNLRQSRLLQRQQIGMQRFFAPVVMEALAGRDPEEVLRPRETDVSVIFCDLRGFTRQSEQSQHQLLELLQRVSDALGVMTGEILRQGGVVGDFHGDAAMGFWGWPLDQEDAVGRAARTALTIRDAFYGQGILGHLTPAAEPGSRSRAGRSAGRYGFHCGIGLATGRAVVGRIGTVDQVKVTAFGPVVNLASRLEGMTKVLGAEVLLDEASAAWIRHHEPADQMRVRRLARIRPAGFSTAIDVHQLLRPVGTPGWPSDDDVAAYEQALDALIAGQWDVAFERLHQVPSTDRAKDFLTATILRHGRVPPPNWDGVIDVGKS